MVLFYLIENRHLIRLVATTLNSLVDRFHNGTLILSRDTQLRPTILLILLDLKFEIEGYPLETDSAKLIWYHSQTSHIKDNITQIYYK